jgi:hypothetical protein
MTFAFEDIDLTILRKAQNALHKDDLFARCLTHPSPASGQPAPASASQRKSPRAGAGLNSDKPERVQ